MAEGKNIAWVWIVECRDEDGRWNPARVETWWNKRFATNDARYLNRVEPRTFRVRKYVRVDKP